MPDAPSGGGGNGVERFLHGKTAGLPNSVWVIVVGLALGYGYYRRKHNATPASDSSGGVASDGSTTVSGQAPAEFISAGAPTASQDDLKAPQSNTEWLNKAFKELAAGKSPYVQPSTPNDIFHIQEALNKYISGQALWQSEADIVGAAEALADVGPPPMTPPLGGILTPPASPVAPPPVTAAPPPPVSPVPLPNAKPKRQPYTVARGDTLSSIARKYGISWQSIYNANRNKISNPNLIYPRQVLNIP